MAPLEASRRRLVAAEAGRRVQTEPGARAGDGDVGLAFGEATVQVDVQVVDGGALRLVHGERPCEREWYLWSRVSGTGHGEAPVQGLGLGYRVRGMECGAWDSGWADLPEPRKGSWLGYNVCMGRGWCCTCVRVSVPLR